MPIYEYHCDSCGRGEQRVARISEHKKQIDCQCGQVMRQVLSAPLFNIQESFAAECPITGRAITSHRQRRNIMAEHGLIDARDMGKSSDYIAKRKEERKSREELAAQLPKPKGLEEIKQRFLNERA